MKYHGNEQSIVVESPRRFPVNESLPEARQDQVLVTIKLFHTAVWAFFAACILALPIVGWLHRFDCAILLTLLILVECGVLAMNRGRCPLTDLAQRFTSDRSATSDIYLPAWLARQNKTIFGTLFILEELILLWWWLRY
jgi:hypothetical protein